MSGRHPAVARHRHSGRLWHLAAGPTTWVSHFLLCYVTAAVYCAKSSQAAPLGSVRVALWLYTFIALTVIVAFGWRGWHRHRAGDETLPHDAGTADDRSRFLGFATFLLCGLSAAAVTYTALAVAVIGTCR